MASTRRPVSSSLFLVLVLFPWGSVARSQTGDPPAQDSESSLPAEFQVSAVLEGHSAHGDAFNEGPRQAAKLMGRGISTPFAVSTSDPLARAFFEQGICQLHGFWYFEAERSFRQVAALDPDCAMAYWGMAMANFENEDRAPGLAREAWLRRHQASAYEQRWIEAIARFFGVDYAEFADEEGDSPGVDSASESAESADGVMTVELPCPPPGAESSDGGGCEVQTGCEAPDADAVTALDPAEREARRREYEEQQLESLEPGDVKKRLGRFIRDLELIVAEYPDDIEAKAFLVNQMWLNQRKGLSITSRAANQALLDQIFAVAPNHPAHHYEIHLWDVDERGHMALDSAAVIGPAVPGIAHMWHMGGHIFARLGRHAEAAWLQEASARVDHAHMMRDRVLPDQIHNFAHNNEWLVRSLRHVGRVNDAVDLARNMIELPRHPKWNELTDRGSARYGRTRLLETLQWFERWDDLIAACRSMYLGSTEERADEAARLRALGEALCHLGRLEEAGAQLEELEELLREQKAERAQAVDEAEEAALAEKQKRQEIAQAMEQALEEHTSPLTRIRREKAVLEQLVAWFEDAGEADVDALKEAGYESFALARLCLERGLHERADEFSKKAEEDKRCEALALATRAHVLAGLEREEEALEVFDRLREVSAAFDLEHAVFQRLAPLAAARGLGEDWRVAAVVPDDVGERPDLDTLGPFRWSPQLAQPFALADAHGTIHSLEQYRGRPVLVVFFLGFGCVHCVEQLQAIGPRAEEFAAAGVEILAIGNEGLEMNVEDADAYPFPIVADPALRAFKDWRCHDDFEDTSLHGTFLVDADGDVRWQDIGYEPFMDVDFLLEESRRLLALPDGGGSWALGATEGSQIGVDAGSD